MKIYHSIYIYSAISMMYQGNLQFATTMSQSCLEIHQNKVYSSYKSIAKPWTSFETYSSKYHDKLQFFSSQLIK